MATGSSLTGIIPFTYFGGLDKTAGSTFLRAEGLVACAKGFEIWKHGNPYDSLIFQKVYWNEMMKRFQGPKILDLCDPDWLVENLNIIEVGSLTDAITCSSGNLTALVKKYFPNKLVVHVPDRLNFNIFPDPRSRHIGKAVNIVWFGYINNAYETLSPLAPVIKKHALHLTIMSNLPYTKEDAILKLNPAFIKYNQSTAYQLLGKNDIVLNPKSTKGFFKYKSNNKTIISWKLGVPVAETPEELERLIDPYERNLHMEGKQDMIEQEYNITRSARQYREIIEMIRSKSRLIYS